MCLCPGLNLIDRRFIGSFSFIFLTIPGTLFLVLIFCVKGRLIMVFGCIVSVVVVTGGELFVTSSFSLCDVLDVSISVMCCVIFRRRIRFLFIGNFCIASTSFLCTASTCCSGASSGRRQCCGNKSIDPDVGYAHVSGTENLQFL